MKLVLNFSQVNDLESMHLLLKEKFGFPDFYGKNVNALIDCWTSLRYPEHEMTKVSLSPEEILELKIVSLPMDSFIVLNHFLIAVQSVNQRYLDRGSKPVLSLILV